MESKMKKKQIILKEVSMNEYRLLVTFADLRQRIFTLRAKKK